MTARCSAEADALVVVDLQSPFLDAIHERDRVIRRSTFLIEAARALQVPTIVTEQAPERLGQTEESVSCALGRVARHAKTSFSVAQCSGAMAELAATHRRSVVVVGVETHICVCGTVLDLIAAGYRVTVCPDAVSSRSLEAHKLGMERIRDVGGLPAHTESVVYEWLGGSTHPAFKSVLEIVKRHAL